MLLLVLASLCVPAALTVDVGGFAQLGVVTVEAPADTNTALEACATQWCLDSYDAGANFSIHVDTAFTTTLYTITSVDNSTAAIIASLMMNSTTNAFICSIGELHLQSKFEGYRPAVVPDSLLQGGEAEWPQVLVYVVTGISMILLLVQSLLLCRFRATPEYAWTEHHKRERVFF